MEQHELTLEDITLEMLNELKAIDCPLRDVKVWQMEAMETVPNRMLLFRTPSGVFISPCHAVFSRNISKDRCNHIRVHPDYYPEHIKPEPVVDEYIICEVVAQDGMWMVTHPQYGDRRLSEAVDVVGFSGVLFEGEGAEDTWILGVCAFLNGLGQLRGVYEDGFKLATPIKVRFKNPQYKGEL